MTSLPAEAGFGPVTLGLEGLVAFAERLASAVDRGGVIHLSGELGAGKTTLARALLRRLGVEGAIKSPTYTLIESYRADGRPLHHLDLYRIADPGELEWLGLPELVDDDALLLVEWPERGGDALPPADLVLELAHAGARRSLRARPGSARGGRWLATVGGAGPDLE